MTHARIPFAAHKWRLFVVKTNRSQLSSSSWFEMRVWVPQKQITTAVSTPANVTTSYTKSHCTASQGLFPHPVSPVSMWLPARIQAQSSSHPLQVNPIHVLIVCVDLPRLCLCAFHVFFDLSVRWCLWSRNFGYLSYLKGQLPPTLTPHSHYYLGHCHMGLLQISQPCDE